MQLSAELQSDTEFILGKVGVPFVFYQKGNIRFNNFMIWEGINRENSNLSILLSLYITFVTVRDVFHCLRCEKDNEYCESN